MGVVNEEVVAAGDEHDPGQQHHHDGQRPLFMDRRPVRVHGLDRVANGETSSTSARRTPLQAWKANAANTRNSPKDAVAPEIGRDRLVGGRDRGDVKRRLDDAELVRVRQAAQGPDRWWQARAGVGVARRLSGRGS